MRILLIDDDPDILALVRSGLEEASFAVDTAENGEKGSFLARTNEYDLIVLDNVMPGKNGLEVCREIRERGKSTPILILSVIGNPAQKAEFLDAGADDYLAKPFSFEELVARCRALLRRPHRVEGEVIVVGNLKIDGKKHYVVRGKKSVYLTRKEFMVVEYLAQHKGEVVSRAMLLEHVWDMNADPFSNTIEAHILSIRKKLGAPQLIYTVPGRGYVLEEH